MRIVNMKQPKKPEINRFHKITKFIVEKSSPSIPEVEYTPGVEPKEPKKSKFKPFASKK